MALHKVKSIESSVALEGGVFHRLNVKVVLD